MDLKKEKIKIGVLSNRKEPQKQNDINPILVHK